MLRPPLVLALLVAASAALSLTLGGCGSDAAPQVTVSQPAAGAVRKLAFVTNLPPRPVSRPPIKNCRTSPLSSATATAPQPSRKKSSRICW